MKNIGVFHLKVKGKHLQRNTCQHFTLQEKWKLGNPDSFDCKLFLLHPSGKKRRKKNCEKNKRVKIIRLLLIGQNKLVFEKERIIKGKKESADVHLL